VIESEKAKFIALETGLTQEDKVEVISGLKAGDTVITRGSNLLKDGDRVRVMDKGQRAQQGGPQQQGGPRQQERQAENQPQQTERPNWPQTGRRPPSSGPPQQTN
jgi:hypothetical protein